MDEIISVKQLSKSYGNLIAVKGLDLSVMRGTVFGLLGANGAGKSTTIECILGTRKPDAGTVSILGMNPLLQRKQLFEDVGVQFQEAKARREVWKFLSELKGKGLTIFLTSHFMDEVEALCDTICILRKGNAVFYGTVEKAVADSPYDNFEDAYLWYSDEEVNTNEDI
jgi:ABC-type multidrug transport system ATPase subunit